MAVQALSQLLEARSPANIPEDTGNPIMHSDIEETKNLPSSSIKRSSGRDSLVSRKRTRQVRRIICVVSAYTPMNRYY